VYSSTESFSSSEETAVIPDDGLFNRKVEEEKIKEQPFPQPLDTRVQSTTPLDLDIFLPYSNR
jgi:hypothetical protein